MGRRSPVSATRREKRTYEGGWDHIPLKTKGRKHSAARAQFKHCKSDLGRKMSEYNHLSSIKIIEQGQEQHHNRKEHINLSEKECLHHDHTQQHRYHIPTRNGERLKCIQFRSRKIKEREDVKERRNNGKCHREPSVERYCPDRDCEVELNYEVYKAINALNSRIKDPPSSFRYRSHFQDENDMVNGHVRDYRLMADYTLEEEEVINKMLLSWCDKIFSSHDHDIREGIEDNPLPKLVFSFMGEDTVRVPCDPKVVPLRHKIYKRIAEVVCLLYHAELVQERFKVDEVLKVDLGFINSYVYYITFTVKDHGAGEGASRKTIQALCKEASVTQDSYNILYRKMKPDDVE